MSETKKRELRWLEAAEHWGDWLRFCDTEIAPPQQVWMMRHAKSGKVRFYEVGKGQVGPEHKNVVDATCWAFANRFIDPHVDITLSIAARAEVLAGGVQRHPYKQPVSPPEHMAAGVTSDGSASSAVGGHSSAAEEASPFDYEPSTYADTECVALRGSDCL